MSAWESIRHRASIAGYVTDAVTGQGIANANVEIRWLKIKVTTRFDGFYYMQDLFPSLFPLVITVPGQELRYGTVTIQNVSVQYLPDRRPVFDPKANAALTPTHLTGTVTRSSDGQPLEKATVRIRGSEAAVVTDENGNYLISGLYAGRPKAEASAEGYASVIQEVVLTAGHATVADFSLP